MKFKKPLIYGSALESGIFTHKDVTQTAQKLHYDVFAVFDFCLQLLEDVNAHKEMAECEKIFDATARRMGFSEAVESKEEPLTEDKKGTLVWSKERGVRRLKPGVSFEEYKAKYPSAIRTKPQNVPSERTLEKWMYDEEHPKAVDGCTVEPDGTCQHGCPSWMIVMGMI